MKRRERFRRCHQPKPFKLGGDLSSGLMLRCVDFDARKVGRILVLEIQAPGDPRCAAGGRVGAGAAAHAAGKILVLAARRIASHA